MARSRLLVLSLIASAACAADARCDFLYSDFTRVDGLRLNGDAAQVGPALRLSQSGSFSSGSVFTTDPVALGDGNSFSTFFRFRITNPGGIGDGDGQGADGLVFVVQTVSNNVGVAGGGIGYSGIRPSVGVEFDTYDNGPGFNDPDGNHVGIDLNGDVASVQTRSEPVRFNNGEVWNAWVDYDGATDALQVRWSRNDLRPAGPQLARTVDLQTLLGQQTAFVGFTSATGNGFGDHELLWWEYRDEFAPITTGVATPAPAAAVALGLGGLMFAAVGRLRHTRGTNIR